jgi:hypothetical protein
MRLLRLVGLSLLASLAIAACGLLPGLDDPSDDCDPRPIGETGLLPQLGAATVSATSCVALIRVDGVDYFPNGGGWLDEDALVLREYGPITHASWEVGEPVAYALDGVDPTQVLVMKTARPIDPGEGEGLYTLLRRGGEIPMTLCNYADKSDRYYPTDWCPIDVGKRYKATMRTICGLAKTMGPYGGSYWRVINPPNELPRHLSRKEAHGTVELLADGRLRFRANAGAVLLLESTPGSLEDVACQMR